MANLALLYKIPKRAQLGTLELDASLDEVHDYSATITKSPVESGAIISDHVNLEPIKVTIRGLVSDVPLTLASTLVGTGASVVGKSLNKFGKLGGLGKAAAAFGVGSLGSLITGNPKDPKSTFLYLVELWRNRVPFTVVTALEKYDNMLIEKLTVPRNASVGGGFQFTAQLEQIRIVSSSTTKIPSSQLADDSKRGQGDDKLGKLTSKTVKEETGRRVSLLKQGFNRFTGG